MKKIFSFLLIFSLVFVLFGCGTSSNTATENSTSDSKENSASVDEIATALLAKVQFNDEIEENENDEKTCDTYGFDSSLVTDIARYVGSGATAEELAIFECVDSSAIETVKTAIDERIRYLHDGYSDYGPDQVPEIDSAVVLTHGNIVVFCICKNPDVVEDILNSID